MQRNMQITFGTNKKDLSENTKTYGVIFCVTENCNLRCNYCYMVKKNEKKRLNIITAKAAIDMLIRNYYSINKPCISFSFIGGEPLLEIDLINDICEYIKEQTRMNGLSWAEHYYFLFTTNGILYNSKKVQQFIKVNKEHVKITISIDGNKIKHDQQRVYPDGRGSYDDIIKNVPLWLEQFPNAKTKATFSHDDIPYIKDSVIHLWNLGIKNVSANLIFEDVWTQEDPRIFEKQLKALGDYVIENRIFLTDKTVHFLDATIGLPLTQEDRNRHFCGSGKNMVAIDCNGNLFPCVRFYDISLSKHKAWSIGNVYSGFNLEKMKPFEHMSMKNISSSACNNCNVANGCMSCAGFAYDNSKFGTILKRTTYHCAMHKANARAVEYFWNKLETEFNLSDSPRIRAKEEFSNSQKKTLMIYYNPSIASFCQYQKSQRPREKMSDAILNDALNFAKKHDMATIFLGYNEEHNEYCQIVENVDQCRASDILIHSTKIQKNFNNHIHIITINKKNISVCADWVKEIISTSIRPLRINISTPDLELWTKDTLLEYQHQLAIIAKQVKPDRNIQINVLTAYEAGISQECKCGVDNITIAPNGKIYLCPGFFEKDESLFIGDLTSSLDDILSVYLNADNSVTCKNCNKFSCNKCILTNKFCTNEYLVAADVNCKKSKIEYAVAHKFNS